MDQPGSGSATRGSAAVNTSVDAARGRISASRPVRQGPAARSRRASRPASGCALWPAGVPPAAGAGRRDPRGAGAGRLSGLRRRVETRVQGTVIDPPLQTCGSRSRHLRWRNGSLTSARSDLRRCGKVLSWSRRMKPAGASAPSATGCGSSPRRRRRSTPFGECRIDRRYAAPGEFKLPVLAGERQSAQISAARLCTPGRSVDATNGAPNRPFGPPSSPARSAAAIAPGTAPTPSRCFAWRRPRTGAGDTCRQY